MKYFKYLRYIFRHKWYVFYSFLGMPQYAIGYNPVLFFYFVWRIMIHDMSKFLPSEFFPYADYFYGKHSIRQDGLEVEAGPNAEVQKMFDAAWLKHIHRNKHHWQYWILKEDEGRTKVIDMPRMYVVEMMCDWQGASKAIRGPQADAWEWYKHQWQKIVLSAEAREFVEDLFRSW